MKATSLVKEHLVISIVNSQHESFAVAFAQRKRTLDSSSKGSFKLVRIQKRHRFGVGFSNLMFTLSNEKNQIKKSLSLSLSVNELKKKWIFHTGN